MAWRSMGEGCIFTAETKACAGLFAFAIAAFAAQPALPETGWQQKSRADGSRIDWRVSMPRGQGPHTLMVAAQGSGCSPVASNPNMDVIRANFPQYAVLEVEKYGVAPNGPPPKSDTDCSQTFYARNTVSQRVADYASVIGGLRESDWWNGRLVLFGGSAGGLVMAMLSASVAPDATILLSTGGGLPFRETVRLSVPKEALPQIDAAFDDVRKHPQSTKLFAGTSYRWWSDMIDRRVGDDMLKANGPFLLIQGGMDEASPALSRAAVDMFADAGRCNLTYWEYSGFDHAMADRAGVSHLDAVLKAAARWTELQLRQPGDADCMTQGTAP